MNPAMGTLEAELKRNPEIVVQLLRLANSSAFGLSRHVSSLRDAIAAIGTRQITRWTQLLLYADGRGLPWRSDPLVQLVGTRARFMELAARVLRPSDEAFADAAFMTGIFSLVHVVVDMPPAEILAQLNLSEEIRSRDRVRARRARCVARDVAGGRSRRPARDRSGHLRRRVRAAHARRAGEASRRSGDVVRRASARMKRARRSSGTLAATSTRRPRT